MYHEVLNIPYIIYILYIIVIYVYSHPLRPNGCCQEPVMNVYVMHIHTCKCKYIRVNVLICPSQFLSAIVYSFLWILHVVHCFGLVGQLSFSLHAQTINGVFAERFCLIELFRLSYWLIVLSQRLLWIVSSLGNTCNLPLPTRFCFKNSFLILLLTCLTFQNMCVCIEYCILLSRWRYWTIL